ncbi:MAG TPA: DUF1510 family protein [Bacillota bacterium]
MSDTNKNSRVDKFQKRRNMTKTISLLMIIGSILFIVLSWILIFGGSEDASTTDESKENKTIAVEDKDETEDEKDEDPKIADENSDEDDESDDEDDEEEVEIEQIESSDDNVVEAYTGNWSPIGTEQQGEHITQYEKGSQDWKEMHEAIEVATKLQEEHMITHWIGNDGEQKVVATVSDRELESIYRVYLSWIDGEGWQPTKVEVLEKVDY